MTDHKRPADAGPSVLHRDMDIEVDHVAIAARDANSTDVRIPIALSSETPVERFDPWEGERYNEVLDHSPESVDLSYARDGMPFLLNHDTGDQIGIIENVALGVDRKLRGMVRFSRSARAQEIKQDILDGIRKKISVGYRIDPSAMETTREAGAAMPTMRAKRWTPLEASSVPIPADYAVGVGRAVPEVLTTPAPKAKENPPMSDENRAADTGAAPTENGNGKAPASAGVVVSVRDRSEDNGPSWADVAVAGQIHGMSEKVAEWQAAGKSARDIMKGIADQVRENLARGPVIKPKVELTAKEEREYSFARALLSSAEGSDSFEMDVML